MLEGVLLTAGVVAVGVVVEVVSVLTTGAEAGMEGRVKAGAAAAVVEVVLAGRVVVAAGVAEVAEAPNENPPVAGVVVLAVVVAAGVVVEALKVEGIAGVLPNNEVEAVAGAVGVLVADAPKLNPVD